MSSFASFTKFKFDNTLGALLIGVIISTALFGLTTLQTYRYYVDYPVDKAVHKWLVGILWILDLTHTIFISHSAYYFLVQQYGNPLALLDGEWSMILEVTLTVCVTVLFQCFFAHRVYRLSEGNWVVTGIILVLMLGHAGLGIASTIRLFQISIFARLPEIMAILSATAIVMAVNDVLITVTLCWYLQKAQKPSGGHDAISSLIVYTIETGMLTSIFVTVDAICLLTMPRNWISIGMQFCIIKLYVNSLLTVLNSRHSVRTKFVDIMPSPRRTSGQRPPISPLSLSRIKVTTEEYVQSDMAQQDADKVQKSPSLGDGSKQTSFYGPYSPKNPDNTAAQNYNAV